MVFVGFFSNIEGREVAGRLQGVKFPKNLWLWLKIGFQDRIGMSA